jgi:hypothetical protein
MRLGLVVFLVLAVCGCQNPDLCRNYVRRVGPPPDGPGWNENAKAFSEAPADIEAAQAMHPDR